MVAIKLDLRKLSLQYFNYKLENKRTLPLIKYLKNSEINFVRWDNCINTAINGNIFAYSWYLNILCNDWEALVMDDYTYVMPLLSKTVLKKEIIFTSILSKWLGVFSKEHLSEEIIKEFIKSVPLNKSIIHIPLNKFNKIQDNHIYYQKTYELDLISTYTSITEKYTNYFQKNLQTARNNKISVINGLLPNDLLNFSSRKSSVSFPFLTRKDIQHFRMIIAYGLRYNLGEIFGAYTAENNLCATAFFLKSKNKIYLMYSAIDNHGLKSNAFQFLLDKYIELHSEKNLTLNIENIVIKNKEYILSGIGAHEYKFQTYYCNKLPWYYKLLIK